MLMEKKFIKYHLNAKDDNDPLLRGLNNLIKQCLSNDYISVTYLAVGYVPSNSSGPCQPLKKNGKKGRQLKPSNRTATTFLLCGHLVL
jgi:hypothetical protein